MENSERLFNGYRRALEGISDDAKKKVNVVYNRAVKELSDNPDMLDRFTGALIMLIDQYGSAAATLSADLFDILRDEALGADGHRVVRSMYASGSYSAPGYVATVTSDDLYERLEKEHGRTIASSMASGLSFGDTLLSLIVENTIMNEARRTTEKNIAEDGKCLGYQIIPSGINTCSFCTLQASRGLIRKGDGHGVSEPYHDHCKCQPYPVWKEPPAWFDTSTYDEKYRAAARALDSGDYSDELKARMAQEAEAKGKEYTKTHRLMAVMREQNKAVGMK